MCDVFQAIVDQVRDLSRCGCTGNRSAQLSGTCGEGHDTLGSGEKNGQVLVRRLGPSRGHNNVLFGMLVTGLRTRAGCFRPQRLCRLRPSRPAVNPAAGHSEILCDPLR